jgi:hypothetical protein
MVGRMRAPLYALQLALLTTHQADAAYQHEWRALGVPGGVDGFLAFNLVAVAALAWGAACALTGVLTGLIHGGLWLGGGSEFTTLPSRALIAAIVLVAALQLGELGRATPAPPPT